MWYERLGFVEDPYGIKRPRFIPLERLTWNRDDLEDKWQLERFIDDIVNQRSVSLRIFGPTRSGKTWLLRMIEKKLRSKLEDVVILYTEVPEAEPTLSRFYEEFIESITPQLERILKAVDDKAGETISEWIKFLGDADLAHALFHIYHKDEQQYVSYQWLRGLKVSSSALRTTEIISPLSNYKRVEVLVKLIEIASEIFPSCVLLVDEIGLVRPPSLARVIGSTLKELLDRLYAKFGLVCTYTAELSDQIVDVGYSVHFHKRFNYEVKLDPIERNYFPTFLRLHHECYRKEDFEVEDQLYPFTEDGAYKLLEILRGESHYPGPILHSCGMLAREAVDEEVRELDEEFIEENASRIPKDYLP
jgi:hypothetical protein